MSRAAVPPRRSTDAEVEALDALCRRLSNFGEVVDLEWLDGFLTALVCAPVRIERERWLAAAFGDAFERACGDPESQAEALALLGRRIGAIESALEPDALADHPDALRLDPLWLEVTDDDRHRMVEEDGVEPADAAAMQSGVFWIEGFLDAAEAFGADWGVPGPADAAADEYEDLLAPLHAALLPRDGDEFKAFVAEQFPQLEGGLPPHDELLTEVLFAVQDLRLWWLDHAPRPETRRVAPQPGRNDPCPCGSGRKFKKCHGAAA